jgi:hypothetical protein
LGAVSRIHQGPDRCLQATEEQGGLTFFDEIVQEARASILRPPPTAEEGKAMQIHPYLFFDGRCEEAIEFYRKALGAEVTTHALQG